MSWLRPAVLRTISGTAAASTTVQRQTEGPPSWHPTDARPEFTAAYDAAKGVEF